MQLPFEKLLGIFFKILSSIFGECQNIESMPTKQISLLAPQPGLHQFIDHKKLPSSNTRIHQNHWEIIREATLLHFIFINLRKHYNSNQESTRYRRQYSYILYLSLSAYSLKTDHRPLGEWNKDYWLFGLVCPWLTYMSTDHLFG